MDLDNVSPYFVTFEKQQTSYQKNFEDTIKGRLNSYIEQVEGKSDVRDTRVKVTWST